MNREALKAAGLTDDQIDVVMAAHGTVINTVKESLNTVTTERDALQGQVTDRDTQLVELGKKVKGDADLTAEIDRLKGENANTAVEYQAQLDKQAMSFATKRVMADYKARNEKAVMALINEEKLELKGEEVVGLKEQMDAIVAENPFLFGDKEQPKKPKSVLPGNPSGGNHAAAPINFADMSYSDRLALKKADPDKYKELSGQ